MTQNTPIAEALRRAERTVTLRPERGQRTFRNIARVTRGLRCEVIEGDDYLIADVGRALGGGGDGPSPSTLLRAALSSCVAIGVKQWALRDGVPIDEVSVTVETDLDARGQLGVADEITPGFLCIRLLIDVVGPTDPKTVDAVIAKSLRYSPLRDVFEVPQTLNHQVRLNGPGAASAPTEITPKEVRHGS
ncbi:MAG: OsmC family protein [Pseudomonadota bacterium]